jgi:hypothetical protein
MTLVLNRIRKAQVYSYDLKSWNYRGTIAVNDFSPGNILTGDNWVLMTPLPVNFNGLIVYPGDMALALVDNAGALTAENVEAGNWKLIRNQGVVGGVLVAKSVFYVDSENYDSSKKRLTIADFAETPMSEQDNVIVKVNGMAYNQEAFAVVYGSNQVVWKPGSNDAGFDLEIDDLIEIMVFRA